MASGVEERTSSSRVKLVVLARSVTIEKRTNPLSLSKQLSHGRGWERIRRLKPTALPKATLPFDIPLKSEEPTVKSAGQDGKHAEAHDVVT